MILKHVGWSFVVFGAILMSNFWRVHCTQVSDSGPHGPLVELRILEIHSFPHFSPTCFDILSWNFVYDFVLLYYRSSLSVVNLCQFLWELFPFWDLEYSKYTVFRIFLLHALTYWAEILHMTLFYCITDQVRMSSICINFRRSNAHFGT